MADDAAVLAVELESLVPVHPHGDGQVEMPDRAVGELDLDEPAEGAEALAQPRAHRDDLAAEEACRVDEVAAVRQHEVAAPVGLRVAGGPPGPRAR